MNETIFYFDGKPITISGDVPVGVDTDDLLFRLTVERPTLSNKPYHAQTTLLMGGKSYEFRYANPDPRLTVIHLDNVHNPFINR